MGRFSNVVDVPEEKMAGNKETKKVAAKASPASASTRKPRAGEGVSRTGDRAGKVFTGGYFSKDLNKAMKVLGLEQEKSVQELVGEAFDLLFRKYGKHPFGEK